MLSKAIRALWGNLSSEEIKRFGMLSLTFMFIIGSYWLMRPLKDGLFMHIVGATYIPWAKLASVVFLVPLLIFYSKLVDTIQKHKLFYVICAIYVVYFIVIAYLLADPTIGLANSDPNPSRLLGWSIYIGIESFGSLVVALFWSFVASITKTDSAKKGFALIISGAQIGSIAGPQFARYASVIGMPQLALIVACGVFMVPVLIKIFTILHPDSTQVQPGENKKKTGALEGLRLIFSKPYLMGVLGIATLYEVVGTIIDYQMKLLAKAEYIQTEKVTEFLALFAQSANGLALVFALLGTSFFIRRYGLTFCLVMFPTAVACVICYVWFKPILWVLFFAMVAIKGLSYALNNPCKEILYIPTSKDAKFKAKGWIDTFGSRSAKGSASGINIALGKSLPNLLFYGSIVSLGIVGFWILVALYVGRTNQKLVDSGQIIE